MELYIESNIEDEFEGWDDGKTFKLDNGTEWELANYTYSYSMLIDLKQKYGEMVDDTILRLME